MPVQATVGRKTYDSTKSEHAEEVMFATQRYEVGDLAVDLNAWPCTGGEGRHNCHALFQRKSLNRRITVTITEDHGGYAANHGKAFGATGKITYDRGQVTYG